MTDVANTIRSHLHFSVPDEGPLTAGIVAALKDVLGDQKGQQRDLVIPVYLGNQLLNEVIVTAQQRMSLRSGGR